MAKLKSFEQYISEMDRAEEIEKDIEELGTPDKKDVEEVEDEAEEVQANESEEMDLDGEDADSDTLLKDLKALKNNEIMTYYTKVGLSKQKGASVCKKENVFLVVNREAILRCGGAQYAVIFGSKNKDYKICKTASEAVKELKKLKVKA